MLKSLDEIITSVQRENKKKIAVAAAADEEIIEVLKEAEAMNLAEFILIGKADEINHLLRIKNVTASAEIIGGPDDQKGANLAV